MASRHLLFITMSVWAVFAFACGGTDTTAGGGSADTEADTTADVTTGDATNDVGGPIDPGSVTCVSNSDCEAAITDVAVCQVLTCDTDAGTCDLRNEAEGATCDDNDACTDGTVCT
ncbi:MAG: hypothetical protein QF464_04165, partial [Myxococcota bacterium]|nr:hypothetical protein [Myxococcota bacterium]